DAVYSSYRMDRKKLSAGFCFFFKAEDGIRDWSVTGVQTCALPICERQIPVGDAAKAWDCQIEEAHVAPREPVRQRQGRELEGLRSEERRVGKEGRWWGGAGHQK